MEYVIVVVQSLNLVQLFVTPSTAASQVSLSFTISQRLLKLKSIESVMASNHLILCHPLLLLPSIFYSIRVFSSESAFSFRWPKYWIFSFNISPSRLCSRAWDPQLVRPTCHRARALHKTSYYSKKPEHCN